MKKQEIYKISVAALLLASGYVLPLFTGQIPEIGNMLLPMHLPVFLAGLIIGAKYGFAVGFILPITRSLFFGMPAIYPNAIAMTVELGVYGLLSGLIFSRTKEKSLSYLYLALVTAMVVGRIAWGIAMVALLGFSNNPFTITAFVSGAVFQAIPGIAIQLVLIPTIMLLLRRVEIKGGNR